MSDFLAEASVLIRPDTSRFRAELIAEIAAATRALPPIPVPVAIGVTGAGTQAAAAAASTAALATAQRALQNQTLGLASTESVLNSALGKQAVLLEANAAATVELAGVQSTLDTASRKNLTSLTGLGTATGKLDAALLGLRTAVGSSAVIGLGAGALAAIALGKAFRASIDLASQFETQMNVLGATTGASAGSIERAAEAARQLGADASLPAVSAGDAAQAITELTKAGLDLGDSIEGARGVLELATAAQIDFAAATELTASALNAFGLNGEQATEVADAFANAANAAQGSISDIAIALQQSAAAASQVGVGFQDTVSLLTLLARNGLRASDAGTSLRVALLRLAAPTNEARAILRQLNIQLRDVEGNIRPEVFSEILAALEPLGPELRDAGLAAIFGADAFRAAALIGREGAAGFAEAQEQIAKTGTAAEVAGARARGFAGDMQALSSSAETAGINIGSVLTPFLGALARGFTQAFQGVNLLADGVRILGDELEDFNEGPGRDFEDRVRGIGSFAADLVERIPGREATREFASGLSAPAQSAEDLRRQIERTVTEINRLQSVGQPTAELRGDLQLMRIRLGELTGDFSGLGKVADSGFQTVQAAISDAARRSRWDEIGDAATRAGTEAGENFGKALAKALDDSVIAAINSAKTNLLSIGASLADQIGSLIDAGPLGQQLARLQNVLTARQASRQRLGLVEDLEDARRQVQLALLETGPLSQALTKLQDQLDQLRRTDEAASGRETLRAAEQQLRQAREAISGISGQIATAGGRRDIQEFLAPFIENVRQAKATLQQQNLEGRIDKLNAKLEERRELFEEDEVATARRRVKAVQQAIEDFDDQAIIKNLQATIAAQKKTVSDGIANLLTQFNQGKIKLAEVNVGIASLLASSGAAAYGKAGATLGAAFRAEFVETLKGLRAQLQALATFAPQTPSAGFAAPLVSPQAALEESQKKANDATVRSETLLQQINQKLDRLPRQTPPPGKPVTASPR